jgi:hypothetical protein
MQRNAATTASRPMPARSSPIIDASLQRQAATATSNDLLGCHAMKQRSIPPRSRVPPQPGWRSCRATRGRGAHSGFPVSSGTRAYLWRTLRTVAPKPTSRNRSALPERRRSEPKIFEPRMNLPESGASGGATNLLIPRNRHVVWAIWAAMRRSAPPRISRLNVGAPHRHAPPGTMGCRSQPGGAAISCVVGAA